MQPSSLIFVAIIAIWAAFLIQHWVRRREHLATVRSVDRFSEAMRVLDRRRTVVAAPTARSYVVSPVRPQAAAASRTPATSALSSEAVVPAVENAPASPPPAFPSRGDGSTAVPHRPAVRVGSRAMRFLAGITLRRVRAVALLALLVAVPVTLLLALLRPLLWAAPVVAIGLLIADLAWLRQAARAARRARAATRVRRVRQAEAAAGLAPADPGAPLRPVGPASPAEVSASATSTHSPDRAAGAVADAPAAPAVVAAAAAAAPGSWAPVPVPPPTYTLKAKAPEQASRPVRRDAEALAAPAAALAAPAAAEVVFDQTATVPDRWSGESGILDGAAANELALRRSAAG